MLAKSQYKIYHLVDIFVAKKVIKQTRDGEFQKRHSNVPFLLDKILRESEVMLNKCMNKYEKWYNSIVSNAKLRTIDGYKERHHIIPVSLGGSDNKENLVDLTAREHFICHWLLTKMHTGEAKAKMIYALNGMKRNGQYTERYETKITSRVYENLKKEFSLVHSAIMKGRPAHNKGVPATEEQKEKNRKSALGKKMSPESITKGVAKRKGQKRTAEQKAKISQALKGKLKGPMSQEEKDKRSIANKGKVKPSGFGNSISSTVAKLLAEGKHYTQTKIQCPHCPVQASKARYNAYHGNKCKQKR